MDKFVAQAMTQDEVFRSISSGLESSSGEATQFGLALLLGACLIVLLAWFARRRQRTAADKGFNHPGKLVREVTRKAGLRPAEMKKLQSLAHEIDASSPMLLLLCPSLTRDALRKHKSR